MSTMFSVQELGEQARLQFEASIYQVGQGKARTAFARALNRETAKAMTGVRRAIRERVGSSVLQRDVNKQISLHRASGKSLKAAIHASGGAMSLKYFRPRQTNQAVSAVVWGRKQLFRSAFISRELNGHVFRRVGKARLPIDKMWGPIIPREMMKPEPVQAFEVSTEAVMQEAMRQLQRLMEGQ